MTDAFQSCLETVKTQDHDRYLACLFAKPQYRAGLFALYAFNCELARIRESVSDPMLGEIRLTWWREAVSEVFAGSVRKHPVVEALAETLKAFPLEEDLFNTMIDARIADQYEVAPENMEALKRYAAETGGTLLWSAAKLCGGDEGHRDAITQLGSGVALAGIVRSIAFHGQMRRVHLPADALAEHGLSEDHIFQGEFGPEIKTLGRTIGAEAAAALAPLKSLKLKSAVRRALVPAVFAKDYLKRSQAADFDPVVDVSQSGSAKRLFQAWHYCQFGL